MEHVKKQPDFVWEIDCTTSSNVQRARNRHKIIYRDGKLNATADTLSRAYCARLFDSSLYDIHAGLCHPGIKRTYHFVQSKNLPYSLDDVRKVVNAYKV